MQRCTLGNFQCQDVQLFWIIVGRTLLAVGAGGGCFGYHLPLFLSSISTEILSQRALKAKQQQQHKFNCGYTLTELKLPVKDGKHCWP